MKIVADENIPLLEHYFPKPDTLIKKPGRTITRQDLLDADLLLVRSVTHVNEALLQNTPIKFVGSATAGSDHLDIAWLKKNNIKWSIATASNAIAVSEYVVTVIAALQSLNFLREKKLRAGVIGVGHIGTQVVEKLQRLGFEVMQCDPIRAAREENFPSVKLKDFTELDFITLHTPLTEEGPHPTYHLIEKDFLLRQKPGCIVLNTGRGANINFSDLKRYGQHLRWCLDVFENEPMLDSEILAKTVIATPHIAGYSVQSKYRGMQMIYQAAVRMGVISPQVIPPVEFPTVDILLSDEITCWQDVLLKIFDPRLLADRMKQQAGDIQQAFDLMRKQFVRHEFSAVHLKNILLPEKDRALLEKIGLKIQAKGANGNGT